MVKTWRDMLKKTAWICVHRPIFRYRSPTHISSKTQFFSLLWFQSLTEQMSVFFHQNSDLFRLSVWGFSPYFLSELWLGFLHYVKSYLWHYDFFLSHWDDNLHQILYTLCGADYHQQIYLGRNLGALWNVFIIHIWLKKMEKRLCSVLYTSVLSYCNCTSFFHSFN